MGETAEAAALRLAEEHIVRIQGPRYVPSAIDVGNRAGVMLKAMDEARNPTNDDKEPET